MPSDPLKYLRKPSEAREKAHKCKSQAFLHEFRKQGGDTSKLFWVMGTSRMGYGYEKKIGDLIGTKAPYRALRDVEYAIDYNPNPKYNTERVRSIAKSINDAIKKRYPN